MQHTLFETNLEARIIEREGDQDYFVETFLYPLNFTIDTPYVSRIQFPMPRAVIIRTSPKSTKVTIHILRDTDLFSSFANFEIELKDKKLFLIKEEGYINLYTKDK